MECPEHSECRKVSFVLNKGVITSQPVDSKFIVGQAVFQFVYAHPARQCTACYVYCSLSVSTKLYILVCVAW